MYDRQPNTKEQSWTFPYLLGKRFRGKPEYALTSRRTFSPPLYGNFIPRRKGGLSGDNQAYADE
jgi:hypothetical protein